MAVSPVAGGARCSGRLGSVPDLAIKFLEIAITVTAQHITFGRAFSLLDEGPVEVDDLVPVRGILKDGHGLGLLLMALRYGCAGV